MRRRVKSTLAALVVAAGAGALAQPARPGRAKAQPCAVCHGALGISVQPDAPNLAGQPSVYLTAQLRAYRNGTRHSEVMNLMAKPLTDDDIQHLATWFSSIRIEASPPP